MKLNLNGGKGSLINFETYLAGMEQLLGMDRSSFHLINAKWHNSFFDLVMPFLRHANFWLPLYLFLFVFALLNFKRNTWWWIVFAACTAILTNFISSDIIKENFYRPRPCGDPDLQGKMRFLVSYCPISSSFTSSHATNHFGLAAFFYFTLRNYIGKWAGLFFVWSILIIYAQVYVGVHYPLDVISGGLIGFVLGYLSARSFNKHYGLAI
jgi:membrane-associated phospholipid phosphatase